MVADRQDQSARDRCLPARARWGGDRTTGSARRDRQTGRTDSGPSLISPSAGARPRHALRGVEKERLFGDALTLPALIRQLIHHNERAVVQLEGEVPAD